MHGLVVVFFLFLSVATLVGACRQPDPPPITAAWTDRFDRQDLGSDYFPTGDAYRLVDGALTVAKAYNHPLWLRKALPQDAVIELDCQSRSPAGDLKIELWGDGRSHASDRGAYTSSGYVFIHGGWNNSKSILARGSEHGTDLVARTQPKVAIGQRYHWKIVRKGGQIDWYVDDMTAPFLSYTDPDPLVGPGHVYLGFNDWEASLAFDNLAVTPLLP